jgi:hypothetical protein
MTTQAGGGLAAVANATEELVPDHTAFPTKVRGGFEIARSLDDGRRSYRLPSDQNQRRGLEVPYKSRAQAQRVCDWLNERVARRPPEPHFTDTL